MGWEGGVASVPSLEGVEGAARSNRINDLWAYDPANPSWGRLGEEDTYNAPPNGF